MSKRFHSTDIWSEDWFVDLSSEEKHLWFFILDDCDHAGIWKPNKRIFESSIRGQVDLKKCLQKFNVGKVRVQVLDNGRWFVAEFIHFQYGNRLNTKNRMHLSIIQILESNGVSLTSLRPLIEVIDTPKDKDKDKDIKNLEGMQGENFDPETEFEKRWQSYPSKDGRKEAFRHFKATVTAENIPLLDAALDKYLTHLSLPQNSYKRPKNGSTWFNNWQDWVKWVEPEVKTTEPGGDIVARSAREELLRELRNRRNTCLPAVTNDAKALFYEIANKTGLKWADLQRKAQAGEDIFNLPANPKPERDHKLLAAGADV